LLVVTPIFAEAGAVSESRTTAAVGSGVSGAALQGQPRNEPRAGEFSPMISFPHRMVSIDALIHGFAALVTGGGTASLPTVGPAGVGGSANDTGAPG
jgi:hypothetical protein